MGDSLARSCAPWLLLAAACGGGGGDAVNRPGEDVAFYKHTGGCGP